MAVLFYMIFVLIMGFVFASVSSSMARRRNRETALWGLFGFFAGLLGGFVLGLIPVILLAILGDSEPTMKVNTKGHGDDSAQMATNSPSIPDRYKEIEALAQLLEQKIITQEEFDREKSKLLS